MPRRFASCAVLLEIFKLLARYRYLPSDYIHAFIGGNAKALCRRLNLLSRKPNVYLARPPQQRESASANHRPLTSGALGGLRIIGCGRVLCESRWRELIPRSETMGQLGFFDAERRLAALLEKGDPLETIGGLVPWESFRADIEAVVLTPEEAKKSKAGRKPLDALVVFRMLVLQALYNLSDEQIEYQVRDRLSFTRFLGLGFEDGIPDGTTLWLFREKLAQAGLIDKLFDQFDRQLNAKGYIARGGQMVDASIVPAPKPRNTREENEVLKRGETPPAWEEKPAKNRQKDKDARWTKKHGKSFFGYKNHVNVDRTHKLIRRYAATDAAEHDSRQLDGLLRRGNTSRDVFGDSAYRSAAAEARLTAQGFRSRIHVRATRGHPLSKAKAAANRAKSRIRARIEHVFGAQETAPGGRVVRTIGIVRARLKIGLQNFVYNIRRLATLARMATA